MTVVFYKLTAFLDCGGKSHETTVPIVVINDLDLNRYRGRVALAEPIDVWSPARSRSDTGLISARLVANKRGYAIGETLTMQVEIYNNSRAKLENINACLVQKGVMKAYGAGGLQLRRVQRLLVKNLCLGRLRNAERLLVDDAKLALPWLVTSEVERSSRLIEIEYYLQLTSSTPLISAVTGAPLSQIVCVGPDYRKSEVVSVLAEEQIVIGMRALREPAVAMETDQQQSQQQQQQQQPNQPLQQLQQQQQQLYPSINGAAGGSAVPTAPPPPPPDGTDLTMFTMIPSAPPSYDEAIGGGGNGHPEKVPLSSPTDSGDSPEREAN
ncbi:hypothetical protein BOX15_Mlig024897g2 [Macrostomum lignano]|nr:hypothetical protein BOX15_Mlig024897g2 [Macrostomum lignano]